MVEKKKILKQLVFFVCILIASSSIVNAQTTKECPPNTTRVPNTNKCCAKFYSVPATKVEGNDCKYPQKNVSSYYSHKGGTYDGVSCPLTGKYCHGKFPFDMESVTYSTIVFVQNTNGATYMMMECKQAQCAWEKIYTACPAGTYFAGWQKVSGNGFTSGTPIQTSSDTSENYSLTVQPLCYYKKPQVTNNGTGKIIESQPIEEPVENVCPKSENKEKITNANNYKFTYNLDGGHFIDGSTERTEIIDSYSVVGAFRLNPLKKAINLFHGKMRMEKILISVQNQLKIQH